MAGGRPRFGVWQDFDRIDGTKNVKCKKCSELIPNAKVEKLDRHILKNCENWTESGRNAFNRASTQERQQKRNRVSLDLEPSFSAVDDRGSNSANQTTQAGFNQFVADYVFGIGAAFRIVEHPSFIEFALKDRPAGLTVPSRHLVSTRLLDHAYDKQMNVLIEDLKRCPYVALAVDGCKVVSHQKKLNFILVAPNLKPRPWKVIATGAESQTSEYIAARTLEVVDEVEAALDKPGFVAGVSTDNAGAMQAAWKTLENEGIICAGCGAHTLNLLLEDIGKLEHVKVITEKATRVATFFHSRGLLLAKFEQERKIVAGGQASNGFNKTLPLPVVTRWYSTYNCIVSVIKNKAAILRVFQDKAFMAQYEPKPKCKTKQKINTNGVGKRKRHSEAVESETHAKTEYKLVLEILKDNTFWKMGKHVIKLLSPIIKAFGLLEADGCSAGMTYWCFVDLLKKPVYCHPTFLIDTASRILELIDDRWKFLHTDAMAVAFLLDPTKNPDDFVDNDCTMALTHVRDIAARLNYTEAQQSAAFREASVFLNAKWDNSLENVDIAPLEWWGFNRKKYPALFEISRRVFTMPTSSAAAERSWSMYKYIHTKLRNLLLSKTVQKLLFVYANRLAKGGLPDVIFNSSLLADWSGDDGVGDVVGDGGEQSSDEDDRSCDEGENSASLSNVDQCFDYDGSQG